MKKILIPALLCLCLMFVSCAKDTTDGSANPLNLPYTKDDVKEYLSLTQDDYFGIEYTREDVEFTEDDVTARVDEILSSFSVKTEVFTRPAQNGDVITFDYTGSIDGVEFDGGKAENQVHTLGSGGFIEGFEEGIVGHKTGETFVVDVRFPDDYYEELAGKDAQFTMTLHKIEEVTKPTLTEEFVVQNTDFATVEEFMAQVRADLQTDVDAYNEYNYQSQIFQTLCDKIELEKYPEKMYQKYYDETVQRYEDIAKNYNQDLETFITETVQSTVDEFYQFVDEYAKTESKNELIFFYIAYREGIIDNLTEEDYTEYLNSVYPDYTETAEQFEELYTRDLIMCNMIYEKVIKLLFDNAKAV